MAKWDLLGALDQAWGFLGFYGADPTDEVAIGTDDASQVIVAVDVSDPANPVETDRLDYSGGDVEPQSLGIDPDNDRVVVTGYKQGDASNGYILLVNYSDPTTLVEEVIDSGDDWIRPARQLWAAQTIAVVAYQTASTDEGWRIFDYSGGTLTPQATIDPGEPPTGTPALDPTNEIAWLAHQRRSDGQKVLGVYNVSDPSNPSLLDTIDIGGQFFALSENDDPVVYSGNGGANAIEAYEWDGASLSLLDSLVLGTTPRAFEVSGDRNSLFVAGSGELYHVDISDPTAMSISSQQMAWPNSTRTTSDERGLMLVSNDGVGVLFAASEEYLATFESGITFSTNDPPDKPTCNVDSVDQRSADLSSSAFSDPDGDPHDSSRWQVRDQGDADWSTPEYDSGWTSTDLTSHTTDRVLTPGAGYEVRVAHRDGDGAFTWSDPVAFTTETLEEVPAIGPEGFFFGPAGRNDLLEFGSVHEDAGAPIRGELLHRAVAPMGALGEHLYRYVRVTITYATELSLTVTPVLDGEELTAEATTFTRPEPNTQETETLEVELGRSASGTRPGLRGTWFRTLLELEETAGRAGFIAVDGIELEWEPVREHTAGLTFHQESLQTPNLPRVARFMFGAGDAVGEFGAARDDLGSEVEAILHSNPVGPAGSGGEAVFTNLYLAITRANPTDLPLNVQAIVDDTAYTVATLTLSGVTDPLLEVVEVPLTTDILRGGVPVARRHLRGSWCEIELDTDGLLPDGDIIFETAELEWEPVQESEGAPVG